MTRVMSDGRLRHRGPDWSGLFVDEKCGCYLAHERLAIIDPTSGDQPLFNEAKDIVVAVSLLSTHARVRFCCIVVCPAQCAKIEARAGFEGFCDSLVSYWV